jgi:hypothetical protein
MGGGVIFTRPCCTFHWWRSAQNKQGHENDIAAHWLVQVQQDSDPWNQPGDWMDVVLSDGVYRQHLADHAGTVLVHGHCAWGGGGAGGGAAARRGGGAAARRAVCGTTDTFGVA